MESIELSQYYRVRHPFQFDSVHWPHSYHSLMAKNIPTLLDIIQTCTSIRSVKPVLRVILLEIFRLFAQANQDGLASTEKSRNMSSVRCIREFLMSDNPNDLYFFISCLECIDVATWAGTASDSPAVLEDEHFGRIMQLLDSLDFAIFRKVCFINLRRPLSLTLS